MFYMSCGVKDFPFTLQCFGFSFSPVSILSHHLFVIWRCWPVFCHSLISLSMYIYPSDSLKHCKSYHFWGGGNSSHSSVPPEFDLVSTLCLCIKCCDLRLCTCITYTWVLPILTFFKLKNNSLTDLSFYSLSCNRETAKLLSRIHQKTESSIFTSVK